MTLVVRKGGAMRILGIDPGFATIGFGLVEADRGAYCVHGYGAISTPPGIPFPRRLEILYDDMEKLLADAGEACFFKEVVKK